MVLQVADDRQNRGMQMSPRVRYSGARPFRLRWTITASLKNTQSGTSSQWSSLCRIWPRLRSNFRVPHSTHAITCPLLFLVYQQEQYSVGCTNVTDDRQMTDGFATANIRTSHSHGWIKSAKCIASLQHTVNYIFVRVYLTFHHTCQNCTLICFRKYTSVKPVYLLLTWQFYFFTLATCM